MIDYKTKYILWSLGFASEKQDALSLVKKQGYTCRKAVMSLGINSNSLSRWLKELTEQDELAFRGNGKLTAEQSDIRQLREEIHRLTMEK